MNIKVAIIGRPNVGKSTIFNILSNNKKAIVYDFAGVTRDRIYGQAYCNNFEYTLIDTPGIDNVVHKNITKQIEYQSLLACAEADCVIFIVENGILLPTDIEIANYIRKYSNKVIFIKNKADRKFIFENYYKLGFGQGLELSAAHRTNVKQFKILLEINLLILLIEKLKIYENIICNSIENCEFTKAEQSLISFFFGSNINTRLENLENIKQKDVGRLFQKVFLLSKQINSLGNIATQNTQKQIDINSKQLNKTKDQLYRNNEQIDKSQENYDEAQDNIDENQDNYDENQDNFSNNIHIAQEISSQKQIHTRLDNSLEINFHKNQEIKIPRISIVGKPNSGKSTYINTLIQENRLITDALAGTTRDSVEVKWKYQEQDLILIDTAGMRKKSKVIEDMENLSVFDSINAIKLSDVVILMIDAQSLIQHQDLEIMDIIAKNGKGLVLAVNKCDLMTKSMQKLISNTIETNIFQMTNVPVIYCSNFRKTNIETVLTQALEIFEVMNQKIATSKLNSWLREAILTHMPPVIYKTKTRIKLKYITQVSNFPKIFKIFSNAKTEDIPQQYVKYLINSLAKQFKLFGISIKIKFHKSSNPFIK